MPKTKLTPTPKKQPETSKKRKSRIAAQKKEVCLKKLASLFLKNRDLAKEFDVSEGMICNTLKAKEHWLAINLNLHQAGLKREKKVFFKRSNGWVDSFKKRHNLKQYNIYGEVVSTSLKNLSTM